MPLTKNTAPRNINSKKTHVMKKYSLILFCILFSPAIWAQTMEEELQRLETEYEKEQKSMSEKFDDYQENLKKTFENYETNVDKTFKEFLELENQWMRITLYNEKPKEKNTDNDTENTVNEEIAPIEPQKETEPDKTPPQEKPVKEKPEKETPKTNETPALPAEETSSKSLFIPSMNPISEKAVISSPFGYRTHPVYKRKIFHFGIDIAAAAGTPIYTTASGIVEQSGWSDSYGNYIIVNHGAHKTVYAHMSKRISAAGSKVQKGDIIGLVGSTGLSTGAHLHYEVIKDGKKVDPQKYL